MFEAAKFDRYAKGMFAAMKRAVVALDAEDYVGAKLFIQEAFAAGRVAVGLQSTKIDERERNTVKQALDLVFELNQGRVAAIMPAEDRELMQSVLTWWEDSPMRLAGMHPVDQVTRVFEIAQNRLGDGEKVLGLIYRGDSVPTVLRGIMEPFLAGEATREATAQRLDDTMARLRKWMQELFLEESPA